MGLKSNLYNTFMIAANLKKLKSFIEEEKWQKASDLFDKLSAQKLSEEDQTAIFQAVLVLHLHLSNQMDRDYISFLKKKISGQRQQNTRQTRLQDHQRLEAVRSYLAKHAKDPQPHNYKF